MGVERRPKKTRPVVRCCDGFRFYVGTCRCDRRNCRNRDSRCTARPSASQV